MADKINSDEILVMRYEKSSNEEDNDCHESSEGQNLERGNQILPNHALNSGEMRAPLLPIEMHISELPNEMLTRIFEQLPMSDRYQVAMVCKRWKAVVYVPLFWKDVTLALNRWPADPGHVGWLLDSLLLRDFRKLRTSDHTVLCELSRHQRLDLHSLTLVGYKFSYVTWSSSLLQPMINLTQLEIRNENACDVRLNDDLIKLVAEHLKKLVTLKVTPCKSLTNRSLEYIAMGLSELKHLSVGNSYQFTDVGVGYLAGIGLNPPPTNLPLLQGLGLHCHYHITILAIRYLCIGQPTIQQLDLFFHGGYFDATIRCLGNMTKLRHLSISGSSWDGSGLDVLADAQLPITSQ